MVYLREVSSLGSREERKSMWMKVGEGRKEYFTKKEVYATDRNGTDRVGQEECSNKGMEGSESEQWRKVGSVFGYSRGS